MTDFAFPPPVQASIGIAGSPTRYPVHRIYCVGRNFAEHAREMGAEPSKGSPVFFMKPADAVIQHHAIPYPGCTEDLHHEVELVVALGPTIPTHWTAENAMQAVYGYAVGLDLTRRDLQAAAKEKRLPWDTSKGFDASAPIALRLEVKEMRGPDSPLVVSTSEYLHPVDDADLPCPKCGVGRAIMAQEPPAYAAMAPR